MTREASIFSASSNGRYDGNVITVLHRGRLLLQVANVLIIEIQIHEGAQLAIVRIQMPPKLWMLRHQVVHGLTHGRTLHLHRRLFTYILAQRRRDVNLAHKSNHKRCAAEWEDSGL